VHFLLDRDWVGVPQLLAGALLALAAVALLLVSGGEAGAGGGGDAAAVPAGGAPPPPIAVRRLAPGEAVTVAGARFAAVPEPASAWATRARRAPARPGQRWVTAAVTVINRTRSGFNPALLGYLVRGPHGLLVAPSRSGVVGPDGLGRASGLPVGAAAEERLVFSLPTRLRHPVLAIEPSPGRALELRLPLAG